jgi:hypothetical protein
MRAVKYFAHVEPKKKNLAAKETTALLPASCKALFAHMEPKRKRKTKQPGKRKDKRVNIRGCGLLITGIRCRRILYCEDAPDIHLQRIFRHQHQQRHNEYVPNIHPPTNHVKTIFTTSPVSHRHLCYTLSTIDQHRAFIIRVTKRTNGLVSVLQAGWARATLWHHFRAMMAP